MGFVVKKRIYKFKGGEFKENVDDILAIERPLEIFVDKMVYSMTMRLPNDDINLVRGILFSNGLIDSIQDIKDIYYCKDSRDRVYVELNKVNNREIGKTNVHQSYSSCGVCGKQDFGEIFMDIPQICARNVIDYLTLFKIKESFESKMDLFYKTGCVHAVSVYSEKLEMLGFGEDVGRHNAFDKCLGKILYDDTRSLVLLAICSSRLSFEMVQKAARLGVQILAGFSAPTSLAVDLARKWGLTLIGFLRKGRFNVYTHPERIKC
ncbi:formate dehydrogenase accessory sulfurtransferase FdhD [Desulfothermus okinawensis JCM 13304]